jgi:hypothetical protein
MSVERAEKNFVAENRKPAIYAASAWPNVSRKRMLKHPNRPAGAGVQSKGAVILGGRVENAIDFQRGGFEFARRTGLIDPFCDKRLSIRGVDLIERAEAPSGIIAGIRQPILRLFAGIQQTFEGDLTMRR